MPEDSLYCPTCGYEYEPWVEACADCGTPLVTRPSLRVIEGAHNPNEDSGDGDDDPRWTVVTNVPNAILGTFVKSQLEDAGIPVMMLRSRSADIAQFSHNDFVPHDLYVPSHLRAAARRLIDSAPGDTYGAHFPEDDFDEELDDTEAGDPDALASEDGAPSSEAGDPRLPGGWQLLPTEADLTARQNVRRTHGQILRGWYWDDEPTREATAEERPGWFGDFEDESDYDEPRRYAPRSRGGWSEPSRFVKIVYGILLLVMSLPFLVNLLQQIWSAFTPSR